MTEVLAKYYLDSHKEDAESVQTTLSVSLYDDETLTIEFEEGGIYINFDQFDLLLKYIAELRN